MISAIIITMMDIITMTHPFTITRRGFMIIITFAVTNTRAKKTFSVTGTFPITTTRIAQACVASFFERFRG
jgi:hypothetical protein